MNEDTMIKAVILMCLILFSYETHPKYKLIVAANRDEAYGRPTAPAHFWEDEPGILAGRDLEKLGTWMGVEKSGRFAALTNYRDPKEVTIGKRTRGELVSNFLKSSEGARDYLRKAEVNRHEYPGYNLLAGTLDELYYYSNRGKVVEEIMPGVYGVSNHLLDTNWPKVEKGKKGLSQIINEEDPPLEMANQLFALLQDADPAPDHLLPDTGVSLEWERLLSSMFIKSKEYGTRSSTVIMMSEEEIFFKEIIYNSAGRLEDRQFTIQR